MQSCKDDTAAGVVESALILLQSPVAGTEAPGVRTCSRLMENIREFFGTCAGFAPMAAALRWLRITLTRGHMRSRYRPQCGCGCADCRRPPRIYAGIVFLVAGCFRYARRALARLAQKGDSFAGFLTPPSTGCRRAWSLPRSPTWAAEGRTIERGSCGARTYGCYVGKLHSRPRGMGWSA